MKFSIITMSFNTGAKLRETLLSIFEQTYSDYEVIITGGGDIDDSINTLKNKSGEKFSRVQFLGESGAGKYDAMNQAVLHASGEFVLFLNSGAVLADENVLERVASVIDKKKSLYSSQKGIEVDERPLERLVLYGDTFDTKSKMTIASASHISGYTCYYNTPSNQSCFYSIDLFKNKLFDLQYEICADYDYLLWCFYQGKAEFIHMDFAVVSEEVRYHESKENRQRVQQEHKQITTTYMEKKSLIKYRAMGALKLDSLRKKKSKKILLAFAVIFFLVELYLMIGPNGWLREGAVNYLTGEGSWILKESNESGQSVCQEFIPQYRNLDSIGIIVKTEDVMLDGIATFVISDGAENILFEKMIPYAELAFNQYMDIPVNLKLSRSQEYYLTIWLEKSSDGKQPYMEVCGKDMYMYENKRLTCVDEVENTQLLTRYIYSNAISNDKVIKILLICIATLLFAFVRLPENRRLKSFIGVILLLAIPYVLGRRLELLTVDANKLIPQAMKWNMSIMYLLELILLMCTQSFRATVIITDVALTILYSANYFVHLYRGVALKMGDLKAIRTAVHVVEGYKLTPNIHLAMAWGIAVLIVVVGWKLKQRILGSHYFLRVISFTAGVLLLVGTVWMLIFTDVLEEHGFENLSGWRKEEMYTYNGYLVSSCIEIRESISIRLEAPLGYSKQQVEEILNEYECKSQGITDREDLPHIILILNESFSDLRILGDLEISEENLEFFYSLKENTVRGNVNTSVLGGGTANSEFEVLTGCSMGLLSPSYYPYQECINKPTESLVSILKTYGYKTYSLHPQFRGNWNRASVYANLGFDESLWEENFKDAKSIHYGVSDAETYNKVKELFENRKENEKLFIFDITLQNHGGYTYEDNCEYNVISSNVSSDEANKFLSLIKESDVAFEQLVSYFAKIDEKVIICMFGDHQPKFSDDMFYEKLYSLTEGLTETDILFNQYKTPFLIWANYDITERDNLDISLNYLGAFLLDTIGIEGSAYFNYLLELMKDYPIITVNGYQDSEGRIFEWSGTKEEFLEYRMLQYNYLFD